jgi:hypothetical protein
MVVVGYGQNALPMCAAVRTVEYATVRRGQGARDALYAGK